MDQESKDANGLLVELDKGLQSPNVGDQCEAVVRFTSLFERYPLPVLVNSAFLKLAEAFKAGSNFIRNQICDVFERNQNHLDKVHNIDDFYRNLFAVTTSNDPIARSLAFLALGHIAPMVSDYKSVHHCISSSLETAVESELTATIICAASYVKVSAEFACNIYPKTVSIIDSDKFSIDTKIRALSVLDHKFYNAHDANLVRTFLIDVIGKTHLKKLICACLTLSTKISYNSLSHITAQIELLLKIFQDDQRREIIRANALKNLQFLAAKSPHIWESLHVEPLLNHLDKVVAPGVPHHDNLTIGPVLSIFCKLLTCKCNFITQPEKDRIFQLCYKFALRDSNLTLCTMAFELLTVKSEEYHNQMATNAMEYATDDDKDETLDAIETFLIRIAPIQKSTRTRSEDLALVQQVDFRSCDSLKTIFRHIVKLCSLNPHYCSKILKLVFDRISTKDTCLADLSPYYTELMCAISQFSTSDFIITPNSCWKLMSTRSTDLSDTNLLSMFVLYFQTLRNKISHETIEKFIERISEDRSLWFLYKVMRQAMRYGHFDIARLICQRLHEQVTIDTFDLYFKSLDRICTAESMLTSQEKSLDENLAKALPIYEDSVPPLRASAGVSKTANFQLQFLWLRIRMLQAHSDLRQCCKIFQVLPINYATLLGAIGALRGTKSDQGFIYLSTIQQMLKISKDFRHLAGCYESLLYNSSKADNRTLDYIYLLKSSNIIMADVIDAVFQYGKNLHVINKLSVGVADKELALEHRKLEATCNKLIDLIRSEITKPGIFPSQKSTQPLILLFNNFSDELLRCPFVYPRYFFQDSTGRI